MCMRLVAMRCDEPVCRDVSLLVGPALSKHITVMATNNCFAYSALSSPRRTRRPRAWARLDLCP